jgi:hypothetical protein
MNIYGCAVAKLTLVMRGPSYDGFDFVVLSADTINWRFVPGILITSFQRLIELKINVYSTNIIFCKYLQEFQLQSKNPKMLTFVIFLQNNSAYR